MRYLLFLDDTKQLTRMVWLAFIAVLLLGASFAIYYYADRYVHIGDQSPFERDLLNLEETLRENPQDAAAGLSLAQRYLQNGRYEDAISLAQQIVTANPQDVEGLMVLGVAYTMDQKPVSAAPLLQQVVSIRRKTSVANADLALEAALYYLGENYIALGKHEEAITALEEALKINRADADAMYLLGAAYAQNQQPEQALDRFLDAVRFVPNFTEAYQGMLESYSRLDMPDHALFARGMVAYSRQDYDAALAALEVATYNLPEFAPAWLGLGLTYEQLGELSAAQRSLDKALNIDSNSFLAANALGRIERTLNEQWEIQP